MKGKYLVEVFVHVSSKTPLLTEQKSKVRGNKIVEGTVLKADIGELEEEVRACNSRKMRK